MVAQSVVQFAQRRAITSVGVMIADYAWGQSFKSSLEDAAKSTPNVKFNVQVAPVPTTNFTPYLRAFGDVSLIVATGHPPGAPLVLAQAAQLGLKAPVLGADGPWSLTAKNAAATAFGRYSDFKCMATASKQYKALAKRYLRTFPQNEFFEDDALAGYAYVKIVAQAIQNVGTSPQAIAAYVHRTTFNIPGYAFPLRWTAWGELDRPTVQFSVLTKGAPPEAGLNTASHHVLAESALQVAAVDRPTVRRRSRRSSCFSRSTAVTKRFGGLPAVDGVTFGIDDGDIVAVVGPNGAGKSTLLKVIVGLERPTHGSVRLDGVAGRRSGRASGSAQGHRDGRCSDRSPSAR